MTEPGAFRVLAICSGNVCRSPFVELLLGRELSSRPDFVVESAGTIASPGQRMTVEMCEAAALFGITAESAAQHEARRLSEGTVARADLILGLTREHRAAAVSLDPGAVRRAFTLNEFARLVDVGAASDAGARSPGELVARAASGRGPGAQWAQNDDDIADPIGQPWEVYQRVSAEIARAVETVRGALMRTSPGTGRGLSTPPNEGPALRFSFRPS